MNLLKRCGGIGGFPLGETPAAWPSPSDWPRAWGWGFLGQWDCGSENYGWKCICLRITQYVLPQKKLSTLWHQQCTTAVAHQLRVSHYYACVDLALSVCFVFAMKHVSVSICVRVWRAGTPCFGQLFLSFAAAAVSSHRPSSIQALYSVAATNTSSCTASLCGPTANIRVLALHSVCATVCAIIRVRLCSWCLHLCDWTPHIYIFYSFRNYFCLLCFADAAAVSCLCHTVPRVLKLSKL